MDGRYAAPPLTSMERFAILERDERICSYCLDPADTVDHILARARGGNNDPRNLTAACRRCNCSKGVLLPSEWFSRDGIVPLPWNVGLP